MTLAADGAGFPSDGNLYPILIAAHLNVDCNNKTLHSSNISHSLVSLLLPPASDERKEASRPKKRFVAADVRKMHDILSKNMYKIRQKVTTPAEKPSLSDPSDDKFCASVLEIMVRDFSPETTILKLPN